MVTRRLFSAAWLIGVLLAPGLGVLGQLDCGPAKACPMAEKMHGCGDGELPDCCRTEAPAETPPQPQGHFAPEMAAPAPEPAASRLQSPPALEAELGARTTHRVAPSRSLFTLFQSFLI